MYPDPAEPTNPLGEARVPKPLTHAQTQVTRINADRRHIAAILAHILDSSTPADSTIDLWLTHGDNGSLAIYAEIPTPHRDDILNGTSQLDRRIPRHPRPATGAALRREPAGRYHVTNDSTSLHVIPTDDLVDHFDQVDTDCICGPTHLPVIRDDGSCGWITIHASLDRRETTE